MSDLVETLRGCPSTACRDWQCVSGFQVCPHDYEEIVHSLEAACEMAADKIERQEVEIERLRAALRKLRDCDWVITPADRMDAVREIAREALGG